MRRDDDFRILRFIHKAQNAAAKMRVPASVAAAALVYLLILEILDGCISALSERGDGNIVKMMRGELRGIRRRADDRTREEEGE